MGEDICVRCKSPVVIQAFQKEGTPIVVLMYECPQCHKKATKGFTTTRGVAIHQEQKRLVEALVTAETPQRIHELEQRLAKLAMLKARYSLGL
jgi:hypothetical protein